MITESFIATQDGLIAAFLIGIVTGLLIGLVILIAAYLITARGDEDQDPHSEPYGG
ncbi:hypothetical protein [Microvirga sp. KLBC 81]|uniref:hypothetical protein n=1 Tax=Microvirga sp. KLBC 81 TaxID=1862707 RepID=UPI0014037BE8|nr:hypothetical protein [Microvirga sp. KLBC 81]